MVAAPPQPLNRKHSLAELLAVLRESFPRRDAGRVQARARALRPCAPLRPPRA